ncbi:hypothetical protein WN944_006442 [Citrus x changshan-huyou]|uniref:Uncharacterized protein n=1 Tax=Citrus x changshan-huyou TaxID=2935761 RepID=A0AAP0MQM3_9ROSI
MRSLLSGETGLLKCMPIRILRLTNLRRLDKFVVSGCVDDGKPIHLGSMKNLQLLRECGMEGLGNMSYLGDTMRLELDKMKNLLLLKLVPILAALSNSWKFVFIASSTNKTSKLWGKGIWGNPRGSIGREFYEGTEAKNLSSLHLLGPRGLGESIELAQMIEDKNTIERGMTFKCLTETKIQDKRTMRLFFRCDEKISSGHRCKDKSLQVLTMCDEKEGRKEAKEEKATVSSISP